MNAGGERGSRIRRGWPARRRMIEAPALRGPRGMTQVWLDLTCTGCQCEHMNRLLSAALFTGYVDDHSIIASSVFEAPNAPLQCAARCWRRRQRQPWVCWRDSGVPQLRLL